jgi:type I restriction enzyme R subunit
MPPLAIWREPQGYKRIFPQCPAFWLHGDAHLRANASYQQIEGQQASLRTTDDLFDRCLHQYTITHAIEDRNVLRFHIDYFKPEGKNPPKPGEGIAKSKVIETILSKHDSDQRTQI